MRGNHGNNDAGVSPLEAFNSVRTQLISYVPVCTEIQREKEQNKNKNNESEIFVPF